MYRRARVAITLAYGLNPRGRSKASNVPTIHVGHARTLLIGSLAAKEWGCPFHVRLDGPWSYAMPDGRVEEMDRGDLVLSVVSCLSALKIEYDAMYWVAQDVGSLWRVPEAAKCRDSWRIPDIHLAQVLDDAVDFAPSLIVRGTEFRPDVDPTACGVVHLGQFIKSEEAVFDTIGEKKHELTVPMISCQRGKMSKSDVGMISWEVLRMVSSDSAKEFLLATASDPARPLDVIGKPLDLDHLNLAPYHWEWSDWTAFVRQAC